jgi:hypothetical protein
MKRSIFRTIVIIICLFGITVCLLLLIPEVRQIIIKLTEHFLLHRELKDHVKWYQVLFSISIKGNVFFGFILCFCIFVIRSKYISSIRSKYKNYKIVFINKEFTTAAGVVQRRKKLREIIKSRQFLILLIIYLLTLGIRIYWLTQKDGFHVDEVSSVVLACYNDYMWSKNYELNKEYTGKEVKEISLCKDDSIKNVFEDIFHLWKDNRDSPHTNLYYSLFRLSLAGLKSGDIKLIIFRGGILNLISFTMSFVFFLLLMKLFFVNSRLLQIAVTACAFLSTATISNTLFLRPYQIQETMFIVFCYYFFKTFYFKKIFIHEETLYINTKLILFLSLITAFTLLTGYYAIIFIGLFGLYVLFVNYKKKNYIEIIYYVVILCLSFLFTRFFYTGYFDGFFSKRALETKYTLFTDIDKNIVSSISSAGILLHKQFFTYPIITVCVLCIIFLIYCKQKLFIQRQALYVFAASVLYVIIVQFVAPYKILRYIMPVYPFLVIFPALMIYSIRKQILSTLAILLLCVVSLGNALNQNKIENLFPNKYDQYYFNKDNTVPVFVINVIASSFWKYADMVPYFNDEQKYYFFDNYEDIFLPGYNEFYLVVEKTLELQDANLTQFETEQEFTIGYFTCKRINLTK